MKNERATMPSDSRQERPTAMMLDANCQVAALKASDIQYAIANSISIAERMVLGTPLGPQKETRGGGDTEKAKRAPESASAGNRVQVEIRPARIATGECGLRLCDAKMELRATGLHRARQRQAAQTCVPEKDGLGVKMIC